MGGCGLHGGECRACGQGGAIERLGRDVGWCVVDDARGVRHGLAQRVDVCALMYSRQLIVTGRRKRRRMRDRRGERGVGPQHVEDGRDSVGVFGMGRVVVLWRGNAEQVHSIIFCAWFIAMRKAAAPITNSSAMGRTNETIGTKIKNASGDWVASASAPPKN